jgi:DNA-binding NarL/FixJ family response regulator
MMNQKRILIVEDHTLFRAGLRALLAQDAELEIVGEADNGRDAVRIVGTLAPDLVLMDLTMPGMNGIEAIREIRRRDTHARILVLTIHKTDEYIHESLKAGADGYMLKDASHDELLTAVHSVLNGKTYLSPDISGKVLHRYLKIGEPSQATSPWDSLTHSEKEVLKLVAEGRQNKYIADYLALSVKTVEKHRSNLMRKLDLHNAAGLTAYAIEKGLLASAAASARP